MKIDVQQIKQRFGIVGNDPVFEQAIRVAAQVAETNMSVLIVGESGVGKEFFPQIIHQYSLRKHKKYIAINCGAIPEGTIDSELFGHRKGSFTGAVADRKGYFEEANGGTIFLDEVGELPITTQARLLRVLENGEFIPVGASQAVKTDIRVVAATNVKMEEAVRQGKFREDLYYRLNTVPIIVPSLRKRKDDIPLLFRRFATDFARLYQIPPLQLTEKAEEMLKSYRWMGNVRELRNMTDRMSVLEEERKVDADTMMSYLRAEGLQDFHPVIVNSNEGGHTAPGNNFANEREILYQVLFDMRREINDLSQKVQELLPKKDRVSSSHENLKKEVAGKVERADFRTLLPCSDDADCVEYSSEELFNDFENTLFSEKEALENTLKKHNNNLKRVSLDLGMSVATLKKKIKKYELDV